MDIAFNAIRSITIKYPAGVTYERRSFNYKAPRLNKKILFMRLGTELTSIWLFDDIANNKKFTKTWDRPFKFR